MSTRSNRWVLILFLGTSLTYSGTEVAEAACPTGVQLYTCEKATSNVRRWWCWEGPDLVSASSYTQKQAYRDLKVKVTFTKGTQSFFTYAFWDRQSGGSQVFRFRTAFPSLGTWTWTTACVGGPCTTDGGLHGRSGSLSVVYASPEFAPYVGGLLKTSPSARYLQWANGSGFSWHGDSAWAATLRSTDDEWACYTANRKALGYTVIHLAIAPEWAGSCNEDGQEPFSNPPGGAGRCPACQRSCKSSPS